MQAVEQPKKSKLWALLSGILGIVWGGLIFVAPSYILPNIFSIVIFSMFSIYRTLRRHTSDSAPNADDVYLSRCVYLGDVYCR